MIDYSPFWMTLQNSKESTYTLINEHKISGTTINRLRKNEPISTGTINDLCTILNCTVQDIAQYIMTEEDKERIKKRKDQ